MTENQNKNSPSHVKILFNGYIQRFKFIRIEVLYKEHEKYTFRFENDNKRFDIKNGNSSVPHFH